MRAPGTIQLDERRVVGHFAALRSFVEKVEDVTTGTRCARASRFQLYSPAIAAAAAEYARSARAHRGDTALQRLQPTLMNLGAAAAFAREIERTREVPLTFTWTAPRDGIVLERTSSTECA